MTKVKEQSVLREWLRQDLDVETGTCWLWFHKWGLWDVLDGVDCWNNKYQRRRCLRCGKAQQRSIGKSPTYRG